MGCMSKPGGNKIENDIFTWNYLIDIKNPNNFTFVLYLPIPIWLNGTSVDIINQFKLNNKSSDPLLSINKTKYGEAIKLTSNRTLRLCAANQYQYSSEFTLMMLTLIPNFNYDRLQNVTSPNIGEIIIYSNTSEIKKNISIKGFSIDIIFTFGRQNDNFEDYHQLHFEKEIVPNGGWQIINKNDEIPRTVRYG